MFDIAVSGKTKIGKTTLNSIKELGQRTKNSRISKFKYNLDIQSDVSLRGLRSKSLLREKSLVWNIFHGWLLFLKLVYV